LQKYWFVFYTKSRQEKKVAEVLARNHFEVFLPLHKVLRQWSDRRKKVEVPLFNSYIFVRSSESRISDVLQTPGIAWSVRYNGKPATIRQDDVEIIQRFLTSGLNGEASPAPDNLHIGDKATIINGPLAGVNGTLEGQPSEYRFLILIESINQVLRVQVPRNFLRKAE
jgi:transcription termination/antitermination protein NusG